mmetsp:Transcript_62027/g.100311  ORF Transcript_62027/g.100311 Transcript_62027/m.100311 type:complete len:201 (+) Transcript_62027:1423-2025(+)
MRIASSAENLNVSVDALQHNRAYIAVRTPRRSLFVADKIRERHSGTSRQDLLARKASHLAFAGHLKASEAAVHLHDTAEWCKAGLLEDFSMVQPRAVEGSAVDQEWLAEAALTALTLHNTENTIVAVEMQPTTQLLGTVLPQTCVMCHFLHDHVRKSSLFAGKGSCQTGSATGALGDNWKPLQAGDYHRPKCRARLAREC